MSPLRDVWLPIYGKCDVADNLSMMSGPIGAGSLHETNTTYLHKNRMSLAGALPAIVPIDRFPQ